MYSHEVAMDTFVLLQADWSVGQARRLVEHLEPTHVIVHRVDPKDYYYLYARGEALDRLQGFPDETPVYEALKLDQGTATPTRAAYTPAETAPHPCVIVDEGHVLGFLDVTVPATPVSPRHVKDMEAVFSDTLDLSRSIEVFQDTTRETGSWDGPKPSVTVPRSPPVPRSLTANFPEKVALGQTVSLLVSLGAESGSGASLPIALPVGTTVDVVVQPKRGFVLAGKGEGSLVISDQEETLPLQFKLTASELGPGKLSIFAFHQGQLLGSLTLAPMVLQAIQPMDEQPQSHAQSLSPVTTHQPDLSLLILEDESQGKRTITFRLTALDPGLGLNLKRFGPVSLHLDPFQYFQDFFQDIETLSLTTPNEQAMAEKRLADKGMVLFDSVIPADLQVLLWSLRDRIKSVQVQSEESWIPWELCKLQGKQNGRVVEGPFFCEAFALTRWLPEIGFKPILTLKKMALVVPSDSGLPLAASERDYMMSLAQGGRQVDRIPATFLELRGALAQGEYDGWHFTGHGAFRGPDPNRSAILLENQEKLTPEDLSGVVKNLGLARPFVFLNACQIGRSAMSLTDIGGWAAQFLRAGAGAFIGPYWSIYDQPACDFAEELYRRLLAGLPVGQAVKEARTAIKALGNPTWLAYTVFADSMATVQA